ncbi:MAG: tetratricopeptide repeat protein [bacterium]|nr:tetratricopeptide repeat protein [bacterium]
MKRIGIALNALTLYLSATLLCAAILISGDASARVVRVEVISREPMTDEFDTTATGPYEVLKGIIHLEVDPDNPANRQIIDLELADRNERGLVEFSTDFELHKPVDVHRGNRRLLYFVNNRGNKMGYWHFNYGTERNWLAQEGWSYLWCGWIGDLPESERKLNIRLPQLTDNGKPLTGRVYAELLSYANQLVSSMPIVWGGSSAPTPVTLDNADATLSMRRYRWREEDAEIIPNDQWAFARLDDGEPVPDPTRLYIKDGFKPGMLYDLVYTAHKPVPIGLGMAAIRDVVSYFRYDMRTDAGEPNPLAGMIDHTYAWGHSQSARLLNHFVYEDFNGDEQQRQVLDGVLANCAGGGKGFFNTRFAQTTRFGSHLEDQLFPCDFFPFNSVEQTDPLTGERGDGLERARKSGFLPKFLFLNTTTDYWGRAASLLHTDVEGLKDAAIDPSTRIYFVAGRGHLEDRVGIVGRALLTALDEWVTDGTPPPDSRIPRIADGTLVPLAEFKSAFPQIPQTLFPPSYYQPLRLDHGPRWREQGIADNTPPIVGAPYVTLVPQVNPTGNEIAGIRLPEIAVPLATFTGWHMRNPFFSQTLGRNSGTVHALPRTREQADAKRDPRQAIVERYATSADYLTAVETCLKQLRDHRLILEQDVSLLRKQAGAQAELIEKMRSGDLPLMEKVALTEGLDAAEAYIEELIAADILWWFNTRPNRIRGHLNATGYRLLGQEKLEDAYKIFTLNVRLHDWSGGLWDSLGECCFVMERYEESRRHYRKALELDPDLPSAIAKLAEIDVILERTR